MKKSGNISSLKTRSEILLESDHNEEETYLEEVNLESLLIDFFQTNSQNDFCKKLDYLISILSDDICLDCSNNMLEKTFNYLIEMINLNETNTGLLIRLLTLYNLFQRYFRYFSFFSFERQTFQFFYRYLKFNNYNIVEIVFNIFKEYLPLEPKKVFIFIEDFCFLFLNDPNLIHSSLNFFLDLFHYPFVLDENNYLKFLNSSFNIVDISDQRITSCLSLIFYNILNNYSIFFYKYFNQQTILLFNELLNHSNPMLLTLLDIILIITSRKSESIIIMKQYFDFQNLINLIFSPNETIVIQTLKCISNFLCNIPGIFDILNQIKFIDILNEIIITNTSYNIKYECIICFIDFLNLDDIFSLIKIYDNENIFKLITEMISNFNDEILIIFLESLYKSLRIISTSNTDFKNVTQKLNATKFVESIHDLSLNNNKIDDIVSKIIGITSQNSNLN